MPLPINWEEQRRQQEYHNWKASRDALRSMPQGVNTGHGGRKDRTALITTVVVLAGVLLCLILLNLLTGCASRAPQASEITQLYDTALYSISLADPERFELAGNGSITVGLPFYNPGNEDSGGTELYSLCLQDGTVTGQKLFDLDRPARLLGVDPQDGVWVYDEAIYRFDQAGTRLLELEPPYPLEQSGVFGFADDGSYTYLLCSFRDRMDSWILIYDRQGSLRFSSELTDYCRETLGYIPREAEWAEELEGRESDQLLSMLFPDGPTDSAMLTTLRDGSAVLVLIRKSPVDSERYCILCTMEADFSLTPVWYYPISDEGGVPYGLPMASPEDRYDLLSPQKDALYGIDLTAETLTPLAEWSELETGPIWFTGWSKGVSLSPDGRLWSLEVSRDGAVIRSVGPMAG